jgi:hypothetical protein
MPKASDWGKEKVVKTSLEIPEDLWRAAKIRAMDERRNLQDLVAEALREFMAKPRKREKKNEK